MAAQTVPGIQYTIDRWLFCVVHQGLIFGVLVSTVESLARHLVQADSGQIFLGFLYVLFGLFVQSNN